MLYGHNFNRDSHTICATCHCPFPTSWLITGNAKRQGDKTFCSEGCMGRYSQDKMVHEKVHRPHPP